MRNPNVTLLAELLMKEFDFHKDRFDRLFVPNQDGNLTQADFLQSRISELCFDRDIPCSQNLQHKVNAKIGDNTDQIVSEGRIQADVRRANKRAEADFQNWFVKNVTVRTHGFINVAELHARYAEHCAEHKRPAQNFKWITKQIWDLSFSDKR